MPANFYRSPNAIKQVPQPSDFMRDGIRATFYLDAARSPCVGFSTVMGMPLGTYVFNDDCKLEMQEKLAKAMCELLGSEDLYRF